jgi:hypothetical protein
VNAFLFVVFGVLVGIGASFTGLGGGFLMVPLLIWIGFTPQRAVGTSFVGIVVIAVSALAAHGRMANVDYKVGFLLGLGGIAGAQIGARVLQHVAPVTFYRLFGVALLGLAAHMFLRK